MVRKEECPDCRGNRYIRIERSTGMSENRRCRTCGGNGYRIRVSLEKQ